MYKKYLIFDLDWTLIKSMTWTVSIIWTYLNNLFNDLSINNITDLINNTAWSPLLVQLKEILKDKQWIDIKKICHEIYEELWKHDSDFFPWIPEKINELSKNYKLFLTTWNSTFVANKFLVKWWIKSNFEVILWSDDILKWNQHLEYFKDFTKDEDFYKKSFYIWDWNSDRNFAKEKEIDFIHIWNDKTDKYEIQSVAEINNILNYYIWK